MASEIKIGGKRKRISTLLNQFYKEYGREPKSDKELQNYVVKLEQNPYQFHATADRRQTLAEQRFTHSLAKEQREDERKRIRLENDLRRQQSQERHYREQAKIQKEITKGVQEIILTEPIREWKTKQAEKVRDYLWRKNKREPTPRETEIELKKRKDELEDRAIAQRERELTLREKEFEYKTRPKTEAPKKELDVGGTDYEGEIGTDIIPLATSKEDALRRFRGNLLAGKTYNNSKWGKQLGLKQEYRRTELPIERQKEYDEHVQYIRRGSSPPLRRLSGEGVGRHLGGIRTGGVGSRGSVIAKQQPTLTTRPSEPAKRAGEIITKPPEKLEPPKVEKPKEDAPKIVDLRREKGTGMSIGSKIRAKLGI